MAISERMKAIFTASRERAKNPPEDTFKYDLHKFAITRYANLPKWEKQARAMADAIVAQDVLIDPTDRIIGRVFYGKSRNVEQIDPDVAWDSNDVRSIRTVKRTEDPAYAELCDYNLANWGTPGHVAWDWNVILTQGTDGLRRRVTEALDFRANDEKSREFYLGILILLDAVEAWNERHIAELQRLGMTEMAEICRRVPKYPARSFKEAVQSYFFQHIIVMKENPYGGNSPGRLDYYLWPFLERDLASGAITEDEAQDLVEELMIRIDERLYYKDTWGESVVVGGSHPNGSSAVNPLSYMMVRGFMKYDITHPYFYIRLPKYPPADFLRLTADYVINGGNRAQIINDDAIIQALVRNGVSLSDAADYYCGGCMEVGVQGRTSDFLFTGYQSLPKMLELCVTGGYCLVKKKQLEYFTPRPLSSFDNFEDFYASFVDETRRASLACLEYLDVLSANTEENRPSYLLSSMVDDCIARGRNMHGGGARYHDYGLSVIGIPNVADSLCAIKYAVFDRKICTADELVTALRDNFEGHGELRRALLSAPKYGSDNSEGDEMAARISRDVAEIYRSYTNRHGGNGKLVQLSFIWSPEAGARLGASPDGRLAGVPVAQSVTPQSASMTEGITAAMNSCVKLPFDLFAGGASTMWDLSPEFAKPEIVEALIRSLFAGGAHFFQGNVTDVDTLRRAQEHPDDYEHLIVRVGGFSARFIWLNRGVQDDIINRLRHAG